MQSRLKQFPRASQSLELGNWKGEFEARPEIIWWKYAGPHFMQNRANEELLMLLVKHIRTPFAFNRLCAHKRAIIIYLFKSAVTAVVMVDSMQDSEAWTRGRNDGIHSAHCFHSTQSRHWSVFSANCHITLHKPLCARTVHWNSWRLSDAHCLCLGHQMPTWSGLIYDSCSSSTGPYNVHSDTLNYSMVYLSWNTSSCVSSKYFSVEKFWKCRFF